MGCDNPYQDNGLENTHYNQDWRIHIIQSDWRIHITIQSGLENTCNNTIRTGEYT